MKVTLLGTGGPKPDPERMGPALLVRAGGEAALFDAGRGVCARLVQAGAPPERLDRIFITHHHFDHVSALADVILSAWNGGRRAPLRIVGPPGTSAMIDALLTRVYRADIDFRLREAALTGDALTPLEALLDIRDIDDGWSAPWAGGRVVAARVSHGHGLGIDQADWCCLGYRIEGPDRVVAISGDAVECAGLDRLASGADLLVMCCYLARAEATERERAIVTRHILADPAAAGRVASRAGVGCLALTHLRQKTPALLAAVEAEARAAYSGRLVVGRDLLTL